ncbi:MAG: hypothetical protein ABI210_11305 [Abditibacteriaceae bacterium]
MSVAPLGQTAWKLAATRWQVLIENCRNETTGIDERLPQRGDRR